MSSRLHLLASTASRLLAALAMLLAGLWSTLALLFAGPGNDTWRTALAVLFAAVTLATVVGLWWRRWRRQALLAYVLAFVAVLVWWHRLEPSNERDWQTDVAVLPRATFDGDNVTVHNIRNFAYRSETDYTPAYYDRRFALSKLSGVDVVAVYWMGPAIAHVFLSFAFDDGEHLAISIETRKEKGEAYSTLKGFFRQYELYYVVADERDVIGLRTNYRQDPPEDVYVFRMRGALDNGRRLFREYMARINALNAQPEFYNTLTTNCTTNIWFNARVNADRLPFSWKILASGYVPEYLYEQGRLEAHGLSFPEIQRQALVNARARAAGAQTPDFSQLIRTASRP
ncbi:MAG TPA: DUF4105 domain-containing protein [Azonexus sp.]